MDVNQTLPALPVLARRPADGAALRAAIENGLLRQDHRGAGGLRFPGAGTTPFFAQKIGQDETGPAPPAAANPYEVRSLGRPPAFFIAIEV